MRPWFIARTFIVSTYYGRCVTTDEWDARGPRPSKLNTRQHRLPLFCLAHPAYRTELAVRRVFPPEPEKVRRAALSTESIRVLK